MKRLIMLVLIWFAGMVVCHAADWPLSVCDGTDENYPNWLCLDDLPGSNTCVFTGGDGFLLAAYTGYNGEPRLWAADATAPVTVFRALSFDPDMLISSWGWPAQFTSLASLRTANTQRFFAASSGGIMEVNPRAGISNALSYLWGWSWDSSYGLRRAGSNLVWGVCSCGSQSGLHVHSLITGSHTSLLWNASFQYESNKIVKAVSREIFGWYDLRGFIWPGTTPPPRLLDTNSVSPNVGTAWAPYVAESGQALVAQQAEECCRNHLWLVNRSNGGIYRSLNGAPFQRLACPVSNPAALYFDDESRIMVVGGEKCFLTRLPTSESVELQVQVLFDPRGGVASPTDKTVKYDAAYGTLPTPALEGCHFKGWWSGVNGAGLYCAATSIVTITSNHTLYASWHPFAMAGHDFDGDRKADPALCTNSVWYAWLSGSGYQCVSARFAGEYDPFISTPVSGDFDGDGKADVAEFCQFSSSWTLWRSGNGWYYPETRYFGSSSADSLTPLMADADGDGMADLIVVNAASGAWTASLSDSGYAEGTANLDVRGGTPLAADFDGDGKADPAMVTGSAWYAWYSSLGYQRVGPMDLGITGTPSVGDYDGDRKPDPVIYTASEGWYLWLSGNGYGRSGPYALIVPGAEPVP
ncbi:MAG: VCBS repeat-containing protein [Kiritimatiellia bacterium]